MRSTLPLVLFAAMLGCDDKSDGTTNGGTFVPPNGTDTACDTATSTCGATSGYMNPVAVGFEIVGYLDASGNLSDFVYVGATEPTLPFIKLTFADEAFFSAGTVEAQEGHFCEAYAPFMPVPDDSTSHQFNTHDGSLMNWSYYLAMPTLEYELVAAVYPCGMAVDPSVWGANAVDLITPFNGARFGYGYGPFTEYLHDQFSDWQDYEANLFANYVAINDASGDFTGYDWNSAMLYEADPITREFVLDDYGDPVLLDISGVLPGQPLPEGIIIANAYWYQDFPLMDFSNLRNGAP